MYPFPGRNRRLWFAAFAAALVAALAIVWLKPLLEQTVRAAQAGVSARKAAAWARVQIDPVDL